MMDIHIVMSTHEAFWGEGMNPEKSAKNHLAVIEKWIAAKWPNAVITSELEYAVPSIEVFADDPEIVGEIWDRSQDTWMNDQVAE